MWYDKAYKVATRGYPPELNYVNQKMHLLLNKHKLLYITVTEQ